MPRIVFQRLERAPPSQGHAHSADNPPPEPTSWRPLLAGHSNLSPGCLVSLPLPPQVTSWNQGCLVPMNKMGVRSQTKSLWFRSSREEWSPGTLGGGGESGVYLGAVYLLFLMGSWGGEFWTLWRIWWICGPSSQKSVHVRAPQAHPCSCSGLTGPWTQPTGPVFVSCFTSVHCADRILNMDKKEKNLRI